MMALAAPEHMRHPPAVRIALVALWGRARGHGAAIVQDQSAGQVGRRSEQDYRLCRAVVPRTTVDSKGRRWPLHTEGGPERRTTWWAQALGWTVDGPADRLISPSRLAPSVMILKRPPTSISGSPSNRGTASTRSKSRSKPPPAGTDSESKSNSTVPAQPSRSTEIPAQPALLKAVAHRHSQREKLEGPVDPEDIGLFGNERGVAA